jgi:hypothetical protein
MVLAAAGVAKLADRAGARSAVTELGVPAGLASPLELVLPLVELVIAGMLVGDRSAVAERLRRWCCWPRSPPRSP